MDNGCEVDVAVDIETVPKLDLELTPLCTIAQKSLLAPPHDQRVQDTEHPNDMLLGAVGRRFLLVVPEDGGQINSLLQHPYLDNVVEQCYLQLPLYQLRELFLKEIHIELQHLFIGHFETLIVEVNDPVDHDIEQFLHQVNALDVTGGFLEDLHEFRVELEHALYLLQEGVGGLPADESLDVELEDSDPHVEVLPEVLVPLQFDQRSEWRELL